MKDYKDCIALTEEESIVYADNVIADTIDEDELSDKLLMLALFTNGKCLKKHYPKLIEKGIFYPCEIYLHADKNIAYDLIRIIQTRYSEVRVNHILICLAWIGTENVIEFFQTTSKEKPIWTKELYILPIQYSDTASWIIDKQNQKRGLVNLKTVALTSNKNLVDKDNKIETFKEKSSKCPFCKNKLVNFFELSVNSDNYQTEFTTCIICSCYEPIFMRIDNKGRSHWFEKNNKWEHLADDNEYDPIKKNLLQFSIEPRKAEYAISQFVEISKSQIGGFPTWIQDSEHLSCPDCNEVMQFIGQIDMEDAGDYCEGIYYFHYCSECKMTGTNFQQT
jgi:DNA-directed RNA polymerase subunit M/transcription elongation factor TFIIS